jgi:hypothetical protein
MMSRPVPNWTCGYTPYLGIVVYDCIPANVAPLWWDDSYMGPSFDDGQWIEARRAECL